MVEALELTARLSTSDARGVYLRDCAVCHGADGSGTARGPTLIDVGRASADAVRAKLCELGVPNLWVPKIIKRVEKIPMLGTGKTDLKRCRELALEADATLMGAVGLPEFDNAPPSQRPEAGLLGMRRVLDVFANLRPVRTWPALVDSSPLPSPFLRSWWLTGAGGPGHHFLLVVDGAQLEFRGDTSNLLNHRNFGPPVNTMNNINFGRNASTPPSRVVQLCAKLRF